MEDPHILVISAHNQLQIESSWRCQNY